MGVERRPMAKKTFPPRDLSEAVYKAARLSRVQSAALVEIFFKEITDCLERGEPVRLSSFGSFLVREARQRMGRNPKTGKQAKISSRRGIVFKPSSVLKRG